MCRLLRLLESCKHEIWQVRHLVLLNTPAWVEISFWRGITWVIEDINIYPNKASVKILSVISRSGSALLFWLLFLPFLKQHTNSLLKHFTGIFLQSYPSKIIITTTIKQNCAMRWNVQFDLIFMDQLRFRLSGQLVLSYLVKPSGPYINILVVG